MTATEGAGPRNVGHWMQQPRQDESDVFTALMKWFEGLGSACSPQQQQWINVEQGLSPNGTPVDGGGQWGMQAPMKSQHMLASKVGAGIQILSADVVQRYEAEVQKWHSLPAETRPLTLDQPTWPEDVHQAAASGDDKLLRSILSGPDGVVRSCTPDRYGRTPLHIAARKGNMQIVKMLLDCWPHKQDKEKFASRETKDGFTAAEVACRFEYEDILEILMVHEFGHESHIVGDMENKYNFKRGKQGFMLRVYDAIKAEARLTREFGKTPEEIIDLTKLHGLKQNSLETIKQLYEILSNKPKGGPRSVDGFTRRVSSELNTGDFATRTKSSFAAPENFGRAPTTSGGRKAGTGVQSATTGRLKSTAQAVLLSNHLGQRSVSPERTKSSALPRR